MTALSASERASARARFRAGVIARAREIRARLRLVSALVLLAFVVCHLAGHMFLLVSVAVAEGALGRLMAFWWSQTGTLVLAAALLVHGTNALWAIYVRRHLRMSRWEWGQLCLGLAIPPLLMLHVVSTKVGDRILDVHLDYSSMLAWQWIALPWLGALQVAGLLTVWVHACIGLHFWLRTKRWYPAWRNVLGALGLLIPALAIAGYVSGGNQILRQVAAAGGAQAMFADANLSALAQAEIFRLARRGWSAYALLVMVPFAARWLRALIYHLRRPAMLTHTGGQSVPILPGATVLETLRAYGIPHAAVCGGRARCTTCRIRVVHGLSALPAPAGLEAKALTRIDAPEGLRLACQIRPAADITVMPLLAADASAADGLVRGGLEGSERLITVVFIDLRGSTTLGEARMPYDVLFILNQFFGEMTKALAATGGHYSQFTGDGLMAIYGLDGREPARGPRDALRGAREMLARLDQLNSQLRAELRQPLRIGISIHFGEAIVGAMGPPRSQIVTAIGDTVNTAARLEGLTKDFDCALILSRRAAEAAGIDVGTEELRGAPVKGRIETVEFYALQTVPAAVS